MYSNTVLFSAPSILFRLFQKLVLPFSTNIPLTSLLNMALLLGSWRIFSFLSVSSWKRLTLHVSLVPFVPLKCNGGQIFNVLSLLLFSFVQDATVYKKAVAYTLFIHQTFVECLLCDTYLVNFPKR